MKRLLPFTIIILVLVVAIAAVVHFQNNANSPAAPPPVVNNPSVGSATPQPVAAINEPGADPPHSIGPASAPVTLEEFGDFQCPPCSALHPELKKIIAKYGSQVRLVFREFPLVPSHEHALTAARSAEAAGLQGKFWEMHALIYENQNAWHKLFDVRPVFEGYAVRLGLDVERFKKDTGSAVVEQRIFLDGKRAHAMGVKGTPTLFLNGREVPFASLPAESLGPLIDAELARLPK